MFIVECIDGLHKFSILEKKKKMSNSLFIIICVVIGGKKFVISLSHFISIHAHTLLTSQSKLKKSLMTFSNKIRKKIVVHILFGSTKFIELEFFFWGKCAGWLDFKVIATILILWNFYLEICNE